MNGQKGQKSYFKNYGVGFSPLIKLSIISHFLKHPPSMKRGNEIHHINELLHLFLKNSSPDQGWLRYQQEVTETVRIRSGDVQSLAEIKHYKFMPNLTGSGPISQIMLKYGDPNKKNVQFRASSMWGSHRSSRRPQRLGQSLLQRVRFKH